MEMSEATPEERQFRKLRLDYEERMEGKYRCPAHRLLPGRTACGYRVLWDNGVESFIMPFKVRKVSNPKEGKPSNKELEKLRDRSEAEKRKLLASKMSAVMRVKTGNRLNWRVGQLLAFCHGPDRNNIYRFRVRTLNADGKPDKCDLVGGRGWNKLK